MEFSKLLFNLTWNFLFKNLFACQFWILGMGKPNENVGLKRQFDLPPPLVGGSWRRKTKGDENLDGQSFLRRSTTPCKAGAAVVIKRVRTRGSDWWVDPPETASVTPCEVSDLFNIPDGCWKSATCRNHRWLGGRPEPFNPAQGAPWVCA